MRIFVTGPCGAGKTTLARLLANALDCSCYDLDDLFHIPSDPPFQASRPVAARLALAEALFLPKADWVLSGNGLSWAAPFEPYFDAVVLLTLDAKTRLARVRARERRRFGDRIAPGADMYQTHQEFMQWIAAPDGEAQEIAHRDQIWATALRRPVIRADAALPLDRLVATVLAQLPDAVPAPDPRVQT